MGYINIIKHIIVKKIDIPFTWKKVEDYNITYYKRYDKKIPFFINDKAVKPVEKYSSNVMLLFPLNKYYVFVPVINELYHIYKTDLTREKFLNTVSVTANKAGYKFTFQIGSKVCSVNEYKILKIKEDVKPKSNSESIS
jgi:hypothetical protein